MKLFTLALLASLPARADTPASQAHHAASAYEAAYSATLPSHVIAANRNHLASLVATNLLGQNTPAIAATEAQYEEMWAQDVAAMAGYHAATASAPSAQDHELAKLAGIAAVASTPELRHTVGNAVSAAHSLQQLHEQCVRGALSPKACAFHHAEATEQRRVDEAMLRYLASRSPAEYPDADLANLALIHASNTWTNAESSSAIILTWDEDFNNLSLGDGD